MIDLGTIAPDPERAGGSGPLPNDDWALDADGLEHRATGYFVAREALGARRPDGLWEWPLHLAEKSWCAPRAFREAFLAALDRFGIERDEQLSRSFAIGFGMRTGSESGTRPGFVALGELVRPKPVERQRPAASGLRSVSRGRMPRQHGRVPVGARA